MSGDDDEHPYSCNSHPFSCNRRVGEWCGPLLLKASRIGSSKEFSPEYGVFDACMPIYTDQSFVRRGIAHVVSSRLLVASPPPPRSPLALIFPWNFPEKSLGSLSCLQIWEDKAREEQARTSRPSASPLSVMDVVEITGGAAGGVGEGRPPRAMVMKTQGVPGLNKISVRSVFCCCWCF